jgi:mxaL protein
VTRARGRALFTFARRWAAAAALPFVAAAIWLPPLSLPRPGFTYVASFDITQSMDTEDVTLDGAPVSRLAFAKASMRDAMGQLPCGSEIGWSVFTGERTLMLIPPVEVCAHYDALLASLAQIDGQMRWTNWSRIAEGGVWSAVKTARELGHGTAVLFFTDGQEAPPLLPANMRAWDLGQDTRGWLIGVGGSEPVPIPKTDGNGARIGFWSAADVIQVPPVPGGPPAGESHEELSSLRGPYLEQLAARIGFSYHRLTGAVALAQALRDPRMSHRERAPVDLRVLPACIALLLLVLRYAPEPSFWRSKPRAVTKPLYSRSR